MLSTPAGLGLYPSDPCFQPTRDKWVPYWMDTNGEIRCLTSGRTFPLAPPPPPAAPQTEEEMLTWTPDAAQLQAQYDWERWKQTNRELAETEGPLPPPEKESTLAEWFEKSKWLIMAAGLGLVAVMRVTRR